MMSALGILVIIAMIIAGFVAVISFCITFVESKFTLLFLSALCLFVFSGLMWTQCHDASFKPVMITISKENITKDKGVYDVKYYKDEDKELKTSDYNDVKYLETLDTNNFLKVCIRYNQPYNMFGYKNYGGEAKIVPCDSTLAQ